MRKMLITGLGLGLLFNASFAQAEELTLGQALKIASQHNPALQEEAQKVAQARTRYISVKALPAPQVEMEVGGLEEGSGNVDTLSVKQSFGVIPSWVTQIKGAKANIKAMEAAYQRKQALVQREVKHLFAGVLVAQKEYETAQTNLNATQQFFTLVQSRFQSGDVLRSDMIRAKIEVLRAQRELLRDEKQIKLNKARLNLLLGRPALTPLELKGELSPVALSLQLETLLKRAKEQRPDWVEKVNQVDVAKSDWQSESMKAYLPKLSLGVEKTREDFENDTSILFEFTYPLWDLNRGKTGEAKAKLKQREKSLTVAENQIGFDVYESVLEVQLAEQDFKLQQQAMQEANELMRQSLVMYQEGEITFLKYLENLAAIRETRLSYFRSMAVIHEKIADLELAIGEEL